MASYISSNDNRFYVAKEPAYGEVPSITEGNRFPAVTLSAKQAVIRPERKDKTGGRTFAGLPTGLRRQTSFEVKTYLSGWDGVTEQPGYGPLFEAAMGGLPLVFDGGTVASVTSSTRLRTAANHGLAPRQAVTFGGELRFVSSVLSALEFEINAPFSLLPGAGAALGKTITYGLGDQLPSASVFDYWSPSDAVQRLLSGAGVDRMSVSVNGDFHEFVFAGPARDIVDSVSFTDGQGELASFPDEPAQGSFSYSVIPGHLGQAWIGSTPERFYTLTSAELTLANGLDTRNREFGTDGPRSLQPGQRNVSLDFSLYQQNDDATRSLYQAARQQSPVSAMLQLGQQQGQLFGIYLSSVIPELPEFDDSEARLQWKFSGCRAQGTKDDELVVAFG